MPTTNPAMTAYRSRAAARPLVFVTTTATDAPGKAQILIALSGMAVDSGEELLAGVAATMAAHHMSYAHAYHPDVADRLAVYCEASIAYVVADQIAQELATIAARMQMLNGIGRPGFDVQIIRVGWV